MDYAFSSDSSTCQAFNVFF